MTRGAMLLFRWPQVCRARQPRRQKDESRRFFTHEFLMQSDDYFESRRFGHYHFLSSLFSHDTSSHQQFRRDIEICFRGYLFLVSPRG